MEKHQILIAATVIAVGLIIAALFGRYEIQPHGGPLALVYRVDRLTGTVESCQIGLAMAETVGNMDMEAAKQPTWCKPSFVSGNL